MFAPQEAPATPDAPGFAPAADSVQPAAALHRMGRGDLDCLAQAVYYEARGESARGQAAVAQVVMNRLRSPVFPKTVCAVVFQRAASGCQFSFACDGSMRRGRERAAWARARQVAARALAGVVAAEVGGATHFHTVSVDPAWGPSLRQVTRIGTHVFYRPGAGRELGSGRPAHPASDRAVLIRLPAIQAPQLRVSMALTGVAADAAARAESAPAVERDVKVGPAAQPETTAS